MVKKIVLSVIISIISVIIINEFILLSRYRESSLVLSINIVTLIAVIVIGIFILDNLKKLK